MKLNELFKSNKSKTNLNENTNETIKPNTQNTRFMVAGELVKAYREYLIENGYMTYAQLIAFDVDVCSDFAKEMHPNIKLSEEDWETIRNNIFNSVTNHREYIEQNTFPIVTFNSPSVNNNEA